MISDQTNANRANEGVILAIAHPNPEVQDKPARRRFTAEYKLRILKLADDCYEYLQKLGYTVSIMASKTA